MLRSGTGSWLYLTDYALRHDGTGGDSQEGLEYMSNGLGPLALAMLMLHTAGQDDPNQWGPQVVMDGHPFWQKSIGAYLHHLPPAPRLVKDYEYRGPVFEPAWFGDGEQYTQSDQFIKILAPLGLYDYSLHGTSSPGIQAVRFIQEQLAQGGPSKIGYRIYNTYPDQRMRDAISYFLLFDPSAPPASDPRLTTPSTEFLPFNENGSMGEIFSRTGNTTNDAFFDWRLGWEEIDHQHGDANSFELWRNGVWLTKRWVGYGLIAGASDYNNALSIQNDPPPPEVTFNYHQSNHRHGGQFAYNGNNSQIVAKSLGKNFLYVSGDATDLYNLYGVSGLQGVEHASRSIVWLKPDLTFVYDRATTASAARFKRFYLALPAVPQINGNVAHVTVADVHEEGGMMTSTPKAELYTSTLLPAGALPTYTLRRQMTYSCKLPGGQEVDCDTPDADQCEYIDVATGVCQCPPPPPGDPNWICPCQCGDQTAGAEPSVARLRVDAPGDPANARFLHVIQGSNVGVAQLATSLVESSGGTAFQGAVSGTSAVLFPVDLYAPFSGTMYSVPSTVTGQLLTGLAPTSTYYVSQQLNGGMLTVQIHTDPGGTPFVTDSGGVLVIGGIEPANVSIVATDPLAAEAGANPGTFAISRSGGTGAALAVHYSVGGSATNGTDYATLNGVVTIPAGQASTTLSVVPINDSSFEGEEQVVVTITAEAAYYAADGVNSASVVIADDDPPPGGFIQFAASSFTVNENGGIAHINVTRSAASAGSASVLCSTSNGSALAGADYQATSQTLSWADGDTQTKTCNVTIIDDNVYEDDETATLKLTNVSGQATLGTPSTATLTVVENDPAPVSQIVLSGASFSVNEAGGQVQITVKRINGKGGPANVGYATVNGSAVAGSDFIAQSGTLTWNNNESFDQTISIPIISDDQFEGANESFTFVLGSNTIPLGSPSSATVTIIDDDPQPLEYDVGPGWDFATIAAVPWQALVAGSTVRIHAEGSPYHEKFLISSRGTAEQPIHIVGVADAGGNRPVIDGANATTSAALHYVGSGWFTEANSIVAVARDAQDSSSFKPGYIDIEGLEVRNVTGSFTAASGQSQSYSSGAGAILIQGGEHVVVHDCVVHDSANGIVVQSQGSEADTSRDITIRANHLYANGWVGQYNGRNVQVDAAGVVIEANRFDPPANGINSYNVEARSSGTVIRYNRIEGGLPVLEIADSYDSIVRSDPAYADAFVYGNLILDRSSDYCNLIAFGGTSGTTGNYHQGVLYFFHNTTVIHSSTWEPALFSLATNAQSIDARNNIFYRNPEGVSIYAAPLLFLPSAGSATLGNNWISSGWQSGGGTLSYNAGDFVVGVAPGFVSEVAENFRLTAAAAARDAGGSLPPATIGYPVTRQYVDVAASETRPVDATADDGAFEYGTVLPTATATATSTRSATATPTSTLTQTPTLTPTYTSTSTPTNSPLLATSTTATPTATPTPSSTPTPKVKGKPRLNFRASPFSVKFKGEGIIPMPWQGVDPLANGIRLEIPGYLDIVVPGGSAWKINSRGTVWHYKDSTGSAGGLTSIVLTHHAAVWPGDLSWSIRGGGGSMVLPPADQVVTKLTFGNADEFVSLAWNGANGPSPHCSGGAAKLACR